MRHQKGHRFRTVFLVDQGRRVRESDFSTFLEGLEEDLGVAPTGVDPHHHTVVVSGAHECDSSHSPRVIRGSP